MGKVAKRGDVVGSGARGSTHKPAGGAEGAPTRQPRHAKKPTNLSLDVDAVARGERFAHERGTSLSTLVSEFLSALPDQAVQELDMGALVPSVRRLHGVAAGVSGREAYRDHLQAKYGTEG